MIKPTQPATRAFQYRTSQSDGRATGSPPDSDGSRRGGRYKLLFSVAYHHDYYGAPNPNGGGNCPDLQVSPTPTSVQLMGKLGFVMKSDKTGFQVYFDVTQADGLVGYLRKQYLPMAGREPGCWERLTFVLRTTNPNFVGFSDLPIGTNPMDVNLYCCNSQAHADGSITRLCQGDTLGKADLYKVVGAEIAVPVPDGTTRVTVSDISGSVVETRPTAPDVPVGPVVNLDLSTLPLDLYTITIHPSQDGGKIPPVIYTTGSPAPLCLIDILLTKPRHRMPKGKGVYPVPPVFGGKDVHADQIGNVAYTLPFGARSTQWRYYVASQKPGGSFLQLRIDGTGANFRQSSDPVQLPDGTPAVLLSSQDWLAMRRIPPQRFRLTGLRQNPDGSQTDIRVDCLPAAPQAPVWPDTDPKHKHRDMHGVSEMYVYT